MDDTDMDPPPNASPPPSETRASANEAASAQPSSLSGAGTSVATAPALAPTLTGDTDAPSREEERYRRDADDSKPRAPRDRVLVTPTRGDDETAFPSSHQHSLASARRQADASAASEMADEKKKDRSDTPSVDMSVNVVPRKRDTPPAASLTPPSAVVTARPITPIPVSVTTTTAAAIVAPRDSTSQILPGIAYVEQQAFADQTTPTNPANDRPLNVLDALSYLDAVKNQFQKHPNVYNHFLDIMKEFKSQQIDTPGVIKRVSHLFHGHPALIQGFNTFLPLGYRIECMSDSPDANSITVTTPNGTMTQTANAGSGHLFWSTSVHDPDSAPGSTAAAVRTSVVNPLPMTPLLPPAPPTLLPSQQLQPLPPATFPQTRRSSHEPEDAAHTSTRSGATRPTEGEPAMEPAVQYVQKIKQRCDAETYKQFLEILSSYHHTPDTVDEREVAAQVSRLFKDAPDLRSDFRIFMPDEHAQLFDDPDEGVGTSRLKTPASDGRNKKRDSAAPVLPQKRKRKEKEKEKDSAPSKEKPMSGLKRTKSAHMLANDIPSPSFPVAGYPPSPSRQPPPPLPTISSTRTTHIAPVPAATHTIPLPSLQPQLPPPSMAARPANPAHFFDRVRRALDSRETYGEFLKLVNLFTQDMIDTGHLVHSSHQFLGEGELMAQWKEILGWDENREKIWLEAEAQTGTTLGEIPYPPPVQRGVHNRPSMAELNLRYGSYRKLPVREVNVACSGRDEMCKSVLNDEWVSHPTWSSEDSGFIAHKKNVYEEALHRSEEERHEYDFHIEAVMRTIVALEPINNRIAQLTPEERSAYKLKANLGGTGKAIHQRIIKKIWGRDTGLEVLQAMQDSPAMAIPVVLARLKQKEEEWKRAQKEWNKVWREVDALNYAKSLDCQGITFRAADKKALTAKAFLNQIEAAREEQIAKRAALIDPMFSRTRKRHHLEFVVDDPAVLQDGMKLTFGFLDRAHAQIPFAERKRTEVFLRVFVPLFFGLDPIAFSAAFVVIAQENMNSDVGGSEDGMSVDDSLEISSVTSGGSKRSHKKGGGLSSAGGDLRKKLLKSEQAKSTGRKTRGQDASPSVSRLASPAPSEAASAQERSEPSDADVHAKRGSGRHIFFANSAFYTLLRLLEVLYSRLALFKRLGARLASQHADSRNVNQPPSNMGPSLDEGLANSSDREANAAHIYELMLESCERLFDNELEQGVFEDQMQHMFGVKHGYKIFTIDKVIGSLIKQAQSVLSDPKSLELLKLLKRERSLVSPTNQDQINFRRNVERILGPDENLFRIDWLSEPKVMTIQLLGQDGSNVDDTEVLTARWKSYIDAFVSIDPTDDAVGDETRRPFLYKNLFPTPDQSAPDILAEDGLEIQICMRTYRLFFIPGTEDCMWRVHRPEELEEASAKVRARETEQLAWMKRTIAGTDWLVEP